MQIAGVSVSTSNGVREEFSSAHDPTNLLTKYETWENLIDRNSSQV